MTNDDLKLLIEKFDQSLIDAPRQPETLVRRGMARYMLGEYGAAIADFSAALGIKPDFFEAYNNRAIAHHAQEDFSAALTDFAEAIRLNPAYAEAYNNRGVTRNAQGDLTGALADYDMAIRLKPAYPEAYNNRGAVRQGLRDLPGALADYDMALRLNPNYVEAYDNRGGVNYLLWRHAQAVVDFNRALALYRGTGVANAVLCRLFVCRGDALYHDGNAAGLFADYRRAFQLDPDLCCRLIVERLARDIQANYRVLLANCDKHLQMNPDDFVAYARRGLVGLLVGNEVEGQRDIDLFFLKHPNNPLGLVKKLVETARRYREEHGNVVPGDTPGFRPPEV